MNNKIKATIGNSKNGFSGISEANKKNTPSLIERGVSGIGSANKKPNDTSPDSNKPNSDK